MQVSSLQIHTHTHTYIYTHTFVMLCTHKYGIDDGAEQEEGNVKRAFFGQQASSQNIIPQLTKKYSPCNECWTNFKLFYFKHHTQHPTKQIRVDNEVVNI